MDANTKVKVRKALVSVRELMDCPEFMEKVKQEGYEFDAEVLFRLAVGVIEDDNV